jgi:hypothetical protein
MNKPITIPSPDKKHKVVLEYLGETRAGNGYYSLSMHGFPLSFENRVFGRACLWSLDSRFLAVQEWMENDEVAGPRVYMLLIMDVLAKRECVVATMEGAKGNILPEGFIGESLMYTVIYFGPFGTTKNFESKFQYLTGWQTLK